MVKSDTGATKKYSYLKEQVCGNDNVGLRKHGQQNIFYRKRKNLIEGGDGILSIIFQKNEKQSENPIVFLIPFSPIAIR